MIRLRMLGEIRLTTADGTELDSLLRQPKRLALLAYLASPAPGVWHRRDAILALFWPRARYPPARERRCAMASTSFDKTSAKTSSEIGATRKSQSMRNPSDRPRRSAGWALKDGRIDDALTTYTGELLPGLFPPESAGLQRWADSERDRLKIAISNAALQRLNDLEAQGKTSEALIVARRVLKFSPTTRRSYAG